MMKKTPKTFGLIALSLVASMTFAPMAAHADSSARATIIIRDNDTYRDHGRGYDRSHDRDDFRGLSRELEFRARELRQRIEMGNRSGKLTRHEARNLHHRLDAIDWQRQKFERSGRGLDRHEARIVSTKLDDLARSIRWEKRDGDRDRYYR
jgi:hypothetical protein